MKKSLILIIMLLILCGCNKKEVNCIYKDENSNNAKSYLRVTLVCNEDDNIVEEESLYAVYQFKSTSAAEKNYDNIEKLLSSDSTVKLEQIDNNIVAHGTKDVTSSQYDIETKIKYYEKLGYTCK